MFYSERCDIMNIPYKAVQLSGLFAAVGILGGIIGMIHRYTRVKYKGKVYRVQLSNQDAMTRSFPVQSLML